MLKVEMNVMNIYNYIHALLGAERRLMENFIKIAEYHKTEPGIYYGSQEMASISSDHLKDLRPKLKEYDGNHLPHNDEEIISMIKDHQAGIDLESDLRFILLLTMESGLFNNLLLQAAVIVSEKEIEMMCNNFERENQKQSLWIRYRITETLRRVDANA